MRTLLLGPPLARTDARASAAERPGFVPRPGGPAPAGRRWGLAALLAAALPWGAAVAQAPQLSLEPHNGGNRSMAACYLNCFAGVLSYTTPSYTSLDTERAVTLVFNSRRITGQRMVQVDATHPSGGGAPPARMSLKLRRADGSFVTWFHTGGTELFYQSGAGTTRLAGWFDDAPYDRPTANSYTAIVTSYFDDGVRGPQPSSVAVRVLSNYSYNAGPYGYGWAVGNVDALHPADGGQVLASGDGSVSYFGPCVSSCSPYTYVSPAGDASVLRRPQVSSARWFERTFPDESVAEYDQTGRLRKVRDRFGNATLYVYNGTTMQLASITDPAGKVTTLHYHATTGYLTRITDPGGARHSYVTVDGSGRLSQIQRPDGLYALRITAFATWAPLTWLDANGGQWDWAWDGYGNPHQLQAPAVAIDGGGTQRPTTSYLSYENAVFAALAGGKGPAGSPGDRIVPGSASIRAIVASPKGHHTYLTLDRWGAPTLLDEGSGRLSYARRDTLGRLLWTRSPAGHALSYSYSSTAATKYNLIQVHDSTRQAAQNYDYVTGTSYMSRSYGALEDSAWYDWTTTGIKKLNKVRRGRSTDVGTRYTYDTRGRATLVQDGRDHEQRIYYAAGTTFWNTDSTKQGQFRTAYTYDAHGRHATVKVPTGEITTTMYDLLNRVTQVTAPARGTTTYYHGAYADSVRDAKGQMYRMFRNALGWKTHEVDPYGATTYARHDLHGNVTWTKNRRQQEVTLSYDGLDQLTGRTADGQTTGYATDPLGRWTATWNNESRDTIYFDALGQDTLAVAIRGGTDRHTVHSAYTSKGQRSVVDYNRPAYGWGRAALYGYDARGQLASLTFSGATTTLSYDAEGVLRGVRLPYHSAGDTAQLVSSGLHRPTEVNFSLAIPSLVTLGRSYEYDGQSRVTARLRGGGYGREFGYDGAGRLTAHQDFRRTGSCTPIYMHDDPLPGEEPIGQDCSQPPDYTGFAGRAYQYDLVGNPLHGVNGTAVNGNRLTQYNGYSAGYDNDGNVIYRHATSSTTNDYGLMWNTLGQLDSLWAQNYAWVDYGYDGWGRRVRKTYRHFGTTQRYVYNGDNIVTDYDDAGNLPYYYSYYPGADRPHALWRWDGLYYFQQDAEGNVVALADSSGIAVNRYDYSPFGGHESTPVEAVPNRYRFKGREYDAETGMYYMRARYYEPRLERFISEDPIGLAGGINPYTFAGNDPVNYRDPSGTCPAGQDLVLEFEGDKWTGVAECDTADDADGWRQLVIRIAIGLSGLIGADALYRHGDLGEPPTTGMDPANQPPSQRQPGQKGDRGSGPKGGPKGGNGPGGSPDPDGTDDGFKFDAGFRWPSGNPAYYPGGSTLGTTPGIPGFGGRSYGIDFGRILSTPVPLPPGGSAPLPPWSAPGRLPIRIR